MKTGLRQLMPRRRRHTGTTDPEIRTLREARRRRRLAVIPSLFTLGNLVCGFAAIVQVASLRFDPVAKTMLNPENLVHAGWLVLLAMVFDGLDGRIARMTKSAGQFGGELDSLCDAVTFGVAPGIMVAMANAQAISSPLLAKMAWLFGAAMACGAILRLARFNVENTPDDESHMSFKGLPSPAAAGTIAALAVLQGFLRSDREVLAWARPETLRAIADGISIAMPFMALAVGWLMVSTIRYVHVPNRYLRGKKSIRKIAQIVFVAIVLAAVVPEVGLALVFLGYALSGPIAAFFARKQAAAVPAVGATELPKPPLVVPPPPELHPLPADPRP